MKAESKIITTTVMKPVEVSTRVYTLSFSEDEAKLLRSLTDSIGGTGQMRELVNNISAALSVAGVSMLNPPFNHPYGWGWEQDRPSYVK